MKDTNRRIDIEVEELTRRICFESKPLWERVWIKFKRWFWRNEIEVEIALLVSFLVGSLVAAFCFLDYLIPTAQ